jgi:hypothetical protein
MENLAIEPGWRTTMWRSVIGCGELATESRENAVIAVEGGAAGLCGERGWAADGSSAGQCGERGRWPTAERWGGVAWATLVELIKD